jgi:hypothetical protein
MAADVNGFSLDKPVLIISLCACLFLQIMKNESDKTNERREKNRLTETDEK